MQRPSFEDAVAFWMELLERSGVSEPIAFATREQLCLEDGLSQDGKFRVAYHPLDADAERARLRTAFDKAAPIDGPLGFVLIGVDRGRAVTALLGDEWAIDDPETNEAWGLFFAPDGRVQYSLTTVVDEIEWARRKRRESQRLSGLDYVLLFQKIGWRERLRAFFGAPRT